LFARKVKEKYRTDKTFFKETAILSPKKCIFASLLLTAYEKMSVFCGADVVADNRRKPGTEEVFGVWRRILQPGESV
jgi:hypothetical protein